MISQRCSNYALLARDRSDREKARSSCSSCLWFMAWQMRKIVQRVTVPRSSLYHIFSIFMGIFCICRCIKLVIFFARQEI